MAVVETSDRDDAAHPSGVSGPACHAQCLYDSGRSRPLRGSDDRSDSAGRGLELRRSGHHGGIMESRAKLFGHSIHQMLIVFPLGVLGMAAVFDVIYLVTRHVAWFWAAYHMIAAGVVAGLVAAIFGLI